MSEGDRDFGAEIDALVRQIQADPADAEAHRKLAQLGDEWVRAEGLGQPTAAESETRVALAGWLSHLAGDGKLVHLGWREGAIAASLASHGATVASYLDHPGRAMTAALEHGSERVSFGVLGQIDAPPGSADLVVVETAGIEPVLELARARRIVRAEGWLAVLGMPVLPELAATVDAGSFMADAGGGVVPCRAGQTAEMITLLRSISRPQAPVVRGAVAFSQRDAATEDPAQTVSTFNQLVQRALRRGRERFS